MKTFFFHLCANVCRAVTMRCDGSEITTILNEFNPDQRERKFYLSSLVYRQGSSFQSTGVLGLRSSFLGLRFRNTLPAIQPQRLQKTYFGILSTNLVLKIQPVDRPFFCKSKEHFLHAIYTKNLLSQRTLSHMREFKIYPSNLRRHKQDKLKITEQTSPTFALT